MKWHLEYSIFQQIITGDAFYFWIHGMMFNLIFIQKYSVQFTMTTKNNE